MSNVALLVGINRYETPGNDLRGCLADVHNMDLLLQHMDFSVMRILVLTDKHAVKKSILDSLSLMVEQAQAGDHLVFHMSSHGAQVPDRQGDEADHMTEILCPYDFDWDPAHYITDDEMHEICTGLDPGATLDVILDSCHSGTMLRVPGDGVARFIPYPFELPIMRGTTARIMQGHGFPNVALWAGCRDDQTSADAFINGLWQGAMTWAFVNSVQAFGGRCTRQDIIDRVQTKVDHKGYEQTPQLECDLEMSRKEVFA